MISDFADHKLNTPARRLIVKENALDATSGNAPYRYSESLKKSGRIKSHSLANQPLPPELKTISADPEQSYTREAHSRNNH